MAGISSKAAGSLINRKKYNGIEFDEDLDLDTYEAFYRNLDPQIGRWWEVDPKIEDGQESMSPYNSMADNPILQSDPLGDEAGPGPGIIQLGEDLWNLLQAVRGGENILTAAKSNNISIVSVINAIGNSIQFDQGGFVKVDPKDLPINKVQAKATKREQVTKVFPTRKRALDARPKPSPAKPGQKKVTRQTRNKNGEGKKFKTDGGSQTPHVHDENHNNGNKPNIHYRIGTNKIKP